MRIYVLKELFARAEVDGKNLASETYIRQHFPKCSMYVGYLPTLGETWPHSKGNVGEYSIHEASGFSTFSCIENRCWRALEVTAEYVIPCQPCILIVFVILTPFQKEVQCILFAKQESFGLQV